MTLTVPVPEDLAAHVGAELASTEGVTVDRAMVEAFLALSGDRQPIHAEGAVVPGNLLLAQLPRLLQQAYRVERFERCLTAGYGAVRFRRPVAAGVRLHLGARLVSVVPARGFVRVETDCRVWAEGGETVMTALVTDLFYP